MYSKDFENLRSRTDAKLRYSEVHLAEIRALVKHGGDDFDRAHQESFLYHLLGARDAFLQELNVYYSVGLPIDQVSPGQLRSALENSGRKSEELSQLYALENDSGSWLSHAKEMRDYATHISGVPRSFHMGGEDHGKVFLKSPKSSIDATEHFPEQFGKWLENMQTFLEDLRQSAIKKNNEEI